jgi:hypothetical protein
MDKLSINDSKYNKVVKDIEIDGNKFKYCSLDALNDERLGKYK